MKAFLLAAGLGTRMRPLTDETPKCLLPIGGKPLLGIWLELLAKHGVKDVLVNTHWLPDKVEEFLRIRPQDSMRVSTFHEPSLLGSAGTLLANKGWVSDGNPFFILYADDLTQVDLSRLLDFHCGHGLPFTLGVFKAEDPKRCGIAEAGQDGTVTGFVEKPDDPKSDLAAAGIYVADGRIFDFFPENLAGPSTPLDLGFHVLPNMVGHMKAYLIEEFLMDIGTIEAYERAQAAWQG